MSFSHVVTRLCDSRRRVTVARVQTTHKIPGGSATTYAQYLASTASRGDYYAGDGKPDRDRVVPSRWYGSEQVLSDLGLSGDRPVDRRDLRAVMNGYDPVTREPLRPAGSDGTRTAGIELMMAPPKTVSALWATSDPYRRAQIEVAHRDAVASALRRTEREVALVRRKTNGVVRYEKANSLLAAEFVHTSSRLAQDQEAGGIPDPQLHSHLILFAAERKDGKLAAIESKQLYRSARENGAWYRSELAHNLSKLGLQVDRRTGDSGRYFELTGVPHELAERWSTRSEDVDRAAKVFRQRYGREPRAGELGSLTTSTRGSKSAAPTIDVNNAWRAQGEEHGLNKQYVEGLFNEQAIDNQSPVDLRKELLTNVTRESSMITTHELKAKAYELSAGVCRPKEADRVVDDLVRSGELIRLDDGTWTTRHLRELEQSTVDTAERRASENASPVSERPLKQARREIGKEIHGSLTQEQKQALQTITGPGGIAVLVGRAGTGKGVTIAAAARAWQLEEKQVIGTAVAGAVAQRLQADAKLDKAFTTDGLLNGIEQGRIKLGPNSVVIMDEAGMGDSERVSRLVKATAEHDSKLLLAGDAAQLSAIGPGGLFKQLEGRVPTAELTEVHRAHHAWEREAWEQIRNGEPGPALAQYQAHDRLHIHDTRAQAAEAMVENWDRTRRERPGDQTVMITDASNKERDQINAMAQECRARAGELGSHRVNLPEKPYGLASGDEIMFTAQYRIRGERRVENGITGTIADTDRDEDRVTIKTREREPREVNVNTSEFADISLGYTVHVHKGQGLTAETSGILTGGWQTDKEHAYVAVSRAREQTQIYTSREDLGEQGMDTAAIERLAQRMQRSRAREATIARQTAAQRGEQPQPEHHPRQAPIRRRPGYTVADEDGIVRDLRDRDTERGENKNSAVPQTARGREGGPVDIRDAERSDVRVNVIDLGEMQLAYSQNVYDLQSHTGEPTYALFGGWQTDKMLGYVAAVQHQGHTETYISIEERGDRDIAPELIDRIGQVIERSRVQQANPTPQADQASERHAEPSAELQPGEPAIEPEIQQIIQEQQDRQQDWEHGIEPDQDNDRNNDHGFGIE